MSEYLQAQTTQSILISYSRRDREAVKLIYADLEALGFKLWRDLHEMHGGEPFWEEIKAAIDACESVVLCMSPDALKSEFVQKEWHYAREKGKRVLPVVVADVDFATVPRWMGRVDWKDFRTGVEEREVVWASFIKTLNTPYEGRKVPFMVTPLPPYFVERPEEFEALREALVNAEGAVAITAALQGAGGFGKTTLAMALCHDNLIRGAFDDGILWVTLGETPSQAELINKALDLVFAITGEKPPVNTKEAAKAELAKAIGDRFILLVMDDLWRKTDADIFLTGGQNSAVLITTRYDTQLPDTASFKQNVDAMRLAQAVKLLTWNIETEASHQAALEALANRLGEWAVLLRLVNATLRKRIDRGDTLSKALDYANTALTRKGLKAFDSQNPNERHEAASATLKVSLDLLSAERQAQFARLAIFPEDADLPFTTLEKLWDLDDFDTEETAEALNDASLLLNFELDTRQIRLHDVVRQYLIDENRDQLAAWQADFVANLGDLRALPDEYAWRNVAYHLKEAGKLDSLRELLLDFNFLQAKLNATDPNALLADCDYLADDEAIRLIQSVISMSAHVIGEDKDTLSGQVVGRLMGHRKTNTEIRAFTDWIMAEVPGLYPLHPDSRYHVLEQAGGALIRILVGHKYSVSSASYSPDGTRIVSASSDKTLRVWDAVTGAELLTLRGHDGEVNSASYSPDGRCIASASSDKTLRVWDAVTGVELLVLRGHERGVSSASYSPDGRRIVSASLDKTLRVWDAETGAELLALRGHKWDVSSAAYSPDGRRIVSASYDETLRVWDAETGAELLVLRGHDDGVGSASYSPDGRRIVSASSDKTLRVWDAVTGAELLTLHGHDDGVTNAAYSPDGRHIVSASDSTVRVWHLPSSVGYAGMGAELLALRGHENYVSSVSYSPDGTRIVSASDAGTLRVWDAETGAELLVLRGHKNYVSSASYSPDGARIVSVLGNAGSRDSDKIVQVWDAVTGAELATFPRTEAGLAALRRQFSYTPSAGGFVQVRVKTQQGRGLVWADKHLLLLDAEGQRYVQYAEGERLALWVGDADIICADLAPDGLHLVAGDRVGRVLFLRWSGGSLWKDGAHD